ncbi:MAG: hypothetical protein H6739_22485 [Alphaproteobacteria bacterium]|nr:hypothetical protein [Alphaproteobacteria bacterium]
MRLKKPILGGALLTVLAAAEAHAAPRTREPAPELAQQLAEHPWADAERAVRAAVAAEMSLIEAPSPARDWAGAAQALERSRTQGLWQVRWQLRIFDAAIDIGDVNEARQALMLAEQADGPFHGRRWQLRALQTVTLMRLILPWCVAAITAVGVGTLLDRAASRRRRGDGRARVVLNPYVTGRPLRDGKLVYGRDHILNTLVRGLREGRSYYLTGERRIGKTTLLLQVGELNRIAGGVSVFVDVAGTFGDQALGVLERSLRTAARAAGVSPDGSPLRIAARLAEKGPLLLLVDEVDGLNNASPEARAALRELGLGPDAPGCIVAAGVGFDLHRDEEARRWAQHLKVLDVEPLTDEAGRALLTEPVAGYLGWTPPAVEAVLTAADGRPMIIQLYGLNVVDRVGPLRRTRVLLQDVIEARPAVDKAWRAIQDHGLEDELVPVDVDMAQLELGRLCQEIEELERLLAVRR